MIIFFNCQVSATADVCGVCNVINGEHQYGRVGTAELLGCRFGSDLYGHYSYVDRIFGRLYRSRFLPFL